VVVEWRGAEFVVAIGFMFVRWDDRLGYYFALLDEIGVLDQGREGLYDYSDYFRTVYPVYDMSGVSRLGLSRVSA